MNLINAEALNEVLKLENGSVHLCLIDPPFSSGTAKEGQKGLKKSMTRGVENDDWFVNDSMTVVGFSWFMRQLSLIVGVKLVANGHFVSFIDWRMYPNLYGAIESAGFRICNLIVWNKTYFGIGRHFRKQHELIIHASKGTGRGPFRKNCPDIIDCKPIRNGRHHTQKPEPLLREIITTLTKPGETVLDCFAGSGSTVAAAESVGRNGIGIELSGDIFDKTSSFLEGTGIQKRLI